MMETLQFRLTPRTAFGSIPRGDQIFGQLCCLLREGAGEAELARRLAGYTAGQPFLVVSDFFPAGFLPRPLVPAVADAADRKKEKKRVWLPVAALAAPERWAAEAVTSAAIAAPLLSGDAAPGSGHRTAASQPHNAIHRGTGTTGKGFAPFSLEQYWFPPGLQLDAYAVFDPARLERDDLQALLAALGRAGYGRDASTGLGKFDLAPDFGAWPTPPPDAASWLTLAPMAPLPGDGRGRDPGSRAWVHDRCFYRPFVRFGRHGGAMALTGLPYKAPLLLADTGATVTPAAFDPAVTFLGRGLGGAGAPISRALAATVHQGYAPVLPIRLPPESAS